MKRWLMQQDSMGVERYLYILFGFFTGLAILGYLLVPIFLWLSW